MGQCGCGELQPRDVLKVGGKVMAVEVYKGCEICDTGVMLTLNLFNPSRAKEHDLKPRREFKTDKHGFGFVDYPLLGKDDLIEAVKELEKAGEVIDNYDNLVDWFRDNGLFMLQKAISIRQRKTAQCQKLKKQPK